LAHSPVPESLEQGFQLNIRFVRLGIERINTYSAEISDDMISSKFLEEIYKAVNNGASDNELYKILDRMQDELDNALTAVNQNLDKIYELVNI